MSGLPGVIMLAAAAAAWILATGAVREWRAGRRVAAAWRAAAVLPYLLVALALFTAAAMNGSLP
jgi:hypothetical protein